MMKRFSSTDEESHSQCEDINEEIDSQGPTTIVRGVYNQHSYMVGNAIAQCEIPQVDFLQMFHFLKMYFSSKQLFFIVTIYHKILKLVKSSKTLDDFRLPR